MILSGRDLCWYIETGKLKIDPVKPEQFQQNGVDFILEDVQGHIPIMKPGMSILGVTREVIEMPDDLMAFVGLRSTYARQHLSFNGLTVIDAGFRGALVLEMHLACLQWDGSAVPDLKVPYGERLAHIIFAKTSSPCVPYRGKYDGQRGITGAL